MCSQAPPSEENVSSARFLQSFRSFAHDSYLDAHASAAPLASKQAAAEASFMDNLAERLEAHHEAQDRKGINKGRSSFEEDALRLEERHRQLHKARTRNATSLKAQVDRLSASMTKEASLHAQKMDTVRFYRPASESQSY